MKKLNAYEPPQKKKISRRTMDLGINNYVKDKRTFTIEVGNQTIEFKKFVNALQLQMYRDQTVSLGITSDDETGMMLVDKLGITLAAHTCIIDIQSTLDVPRAAEAEEGSEDKSIDIEALDIYGEYFLTVSDDYRALFKDVYDTMYDYVKAVVEARNQVLLKSADGFDLNALLKEMMEKRDEAG